jgi:hypothetical protein
VKLRIFKQEDGTVDIYAERTRPREGPSQLVRKVPQERVQEALESVVQGVRRQAPEAS